MQTSLIALLLVATVILSAVVSTMIAQKYFFPVAGQPETSNGTEPEFIGKRQRIPT